MTVRNDFHVRPASWSADYADLRAVREVVFVAEQQVPREDEIDAHDQTAYHVIARDDAGRAIGTGRLTTAGTIGRVAALAQWRGHGVGTAIMRALLEQARVLRLPAVELHAQTHAIAFYENLGFSARGEAYMECGIEHRTMRRELEPLPGRETAIDMQEGAQNFNSPP
jgi:predicted GNAT family N-acyltransferase